MVEWIEPLIAAVRALYGQINVAMLLLIFFSGMRLFFSAYGRVADQVFWCKQLCDWMAFMLIIALLFYPLALGVGRYDPYALGYDVRLLAVCAVCALAAVWRYPLVSIWLVGGAVAHAAHLGESNNLWDYLFDPLSVIWALIWWLRQRFGATTAIKRV
jgi:hypothetical protein